MSRRASQTRQRLAEEGLAARVGQPDRVEHPRLGLGDPDRRVPLPRLWGDGLRDERIERPRDLGRGEGVEATAGVQEEQSTGPSTQRRTISPSTGTTQP